MLPDAPEIYLQVTEFGETRLEPFPRFHIPDDQAFFEFCVANGHSTLRFERESDGEVRLMPPSGSETGRINGEILTELNIWNRQSAILGYTFDSSSGFLLPSSAVRAPDVAWVEKSRYDALTDDQREHHAPLAPDFVVEVMSPSDRLTNLQAKMDEYISNGVRLGWLLDRKNRTVYVYRPGAEAVPHHDPTTLSADPELPGFVLDFSRLF